MAGGKNMKFNIMVALVGLMGAGVLSGCNSGMMAEGPNPTEVKAKIAAMSPEKQIAFYQGSPMPPAQKAAKIAEIEKKYGIKAGEPASHPGAVPSQ